MGKEKEAYQTLELMLKAAKEGDLAAYQKLNREFSKIFKDLKDPARKREYDLCRNACANIFMIPEGSKKYTPRLLYEIALKLFGKIRKPED